MAKYATLSDATDDGLTVSEADLLAADSVIDTVLRTVDIDPALEVTLPHTLLTHAAIYYASWVCAIRSMAGENSPMESKARLYKELYRETVPQITRQNLGLLLPRKARYGSIPVERA